MFTTRTRGMVFAAIAAALLLLASCLPFPLGDPAKSKVDPRLGGYWLMSKDKEAMMAMIAPFDERAYVIRMVGYTEADGVPVKKDHMILKAWLTDVKGTTFITAEPVEQLLGGDYEKAWLVYKLNLNDNAMTSAMIKHDFQPVKSAETAEAMAKAIEANLQNPEMYDEAAEWRRLDPKNEKDKALIEKVMGN